MPDYFYRGKYAAGVLKTLSADPKPLSELMAPSAAGFGGRVGRCLFNLVDGEPAGFMEFPDNASAAAWLGSLLDSGTLTTGTIAPLLSDDEWLRMLGKIGGGGGGGW